MGEAKKELYDLLGYSLDLKVGLLGHTHKVLGSRCKFIIVFRFEENSKNILKDLKEYGLGDLKLYFLHTEVRFLT